MELIIKVLTGETCTVMVNPSSTIGDLKCKIAPLFNSSTSRLKLFINNGQKVQLDINQKTVSDYGLSSGSTVMLVISPSPEPFQMFVKNEKGQTKTYEVKEDDTVNQLMVKVSQKEGVPVDQQRLIYNGRQMESGMKLKDYNITPESTTMMLVISPSPEPFQVFVKNEKGQTKTYEVKEDDTVKKLMEMVFQKEGVPVDQQRLIYNGRQLESGMKLKDYNIISGGTIHMTFRLRGG